MQTDSRIPANGACGIRRFGLRLIHVFAANGTRHATGARVVMRFMQGQRIEWSYLVELDC